MNLGAKTLNIIEIRPQAAAHDFIHLAEAERRPQTVRPADWARPFLCVSESSAIEFSAVLNHLSAKRTEWGNSKFSKRNSAIRLRIQFSRIDLQ